MPPKNRPVTGTGHSVPITPGMPAKIIYIYQLSKGGIRREILSQGEYQQAGNGE
jgi:hypothetical protein